MASVLDLKKLKENWRRDPIWDLEDTEGFEDHFEELKAYRLEMENIWEAERNADLIEKSIKMGVPNNLALVKYIENLEFEIDDLKKQIHHLKMNLL